MPLDHFSITVPQPKFEGVVAFMTAAFAHLGFKEFMRPVPYVAGLGDSTPYFWISGVDPKEVDEKTMDLVLKKQHVALTAENAEQVRQFYDAAIKAGGQDNGAPGLRPQSHPGYYGAFVRDPACGINFEVVSHKGEQ